MKTDIKLILTVKNVDIELSPDEAKELIKVLEGIVGGDVKRVKKIVEEKPCFYSRYPWYYEEWYYKEPYKVTWSQTNSGMNQTQEKIDV